MGACITTAMVTTAPRKGLYAGLNLWKTSTARKTQPLMIEMHRFERRYKYGGSYNAYVY